MTPPSGILGYDEVVQSFKPDNRGIQTETEQLASQERIEQLALFCMEAAAGEATIGLELITEKEAELVTSPTKRTKQELELLLTNPYINAAIESSLAYIYLPQNFPSTVYRIAELSLLRSLFAAKYPHAKTPEDSVLISGAGIATSEIWASHRFKVKPGCHKQLLDCYQNPSLFDQIRIEDLADFIHPKRIIATDPFLFKTRTLNELDIEIGKIYPNYYLHTNGQLPETKDERIYLGADTHESNMVRLAEQRSAPINSLNLIRIDPKSLAPFESPQLLLEEANEFVLNILKMANRLDQNGIVNITFGQGNNANEYTRRMFLAGYLEQTLRLAKIKYVAVDLHQELANHLSGKNTSQNMLVKLMALNPSSIIHLDKTLSLYSIRFAANQINLKDMRRMFYQLQTSIYTRTFDLFEAKSAMMKQTGITDLK